MAGGLSKIKGFFNRGHERSQKAKKNIFYSLLVKGVNIGIGFLQVPLILGFIGDAKYGVWLTIGSVISWFSFLDVGLGNGLRNKLAEAFAANDKELGRKLVSSTYYAIGWVALAAFAVFFVINNFVDWAEILKAPDNLSVDLNMVLIIVFGLFCLRFVFKLVGTVLVADQRPAINNAFVPLGNIIAITGLYVAILLSIKGSILYVGVLLTGPVVLVYLVASGYLFNGEYAFLRPSLKFVDRSQIKGLMGLGFKFFILQAGQIIIYTTDNMIITRILGPEEVTTYFIPHKYFSLIIMGFNIIMIPMWSAFTQAHTLNDTAWIKKTLSKLLKIWMGFTIIGAGLLVISPWVYAFWVGDELAARIPLTLSILTAIFVSISSFSSIYINFLNGVGKINLQLILISIAAVVNIPLSVYFGKHLNLGSTGVILASIISLSFFAFFTPIQAKRIIAGKAKGIWNK